MDILKKIWSFFLSLFRRAKRPIEQKAFISHIIRRTPGGHHAWCESSAGIIRKPIESIPINLR